MDTDSIVSNIETMSRFAPLKRKSQRIKQCRPFFEHLCLNRSPQTAEQYAYAAERFLAWLGEKGITQLEAAPRSVLAEYCEDLERRGFLPATVSVQLAAIRRYGDWLTSKGIEIPDFYAPPRSRATPRRVRDILSKDQLEAYLSRADAIGREPVRTATKLIASTGLRSGEVVTLALRCAKRTALELADGTVKTVWSLRVRGKGDHERIVPVLDEGVEALRQYLREWRTRHPDNRWLFPGNQAGHIAAHTLRAAVASIRPDDIEWTPHTLRRTYLTALYRKGVDPVVLAKIAGHADVRTLLQHYLALDEHDLLSAVHRKVS